MKFQLIGPSYTAQSNAVADEECINWYPESIETPGAQTKWSYFRTPGLGGGPNSVTGTGPINDLCTVGAHFFAVFGGTLREYDPADLGDAVASHPIQTDGNRASMVASNTQLLIVSAGRAYCLTFADSTLIEVTGQLAGVPIKAEYNDAYFVVSFKNSNKYQYSALEDGTSWPGINVNAVSVFADNIVSIICDHRELWVFGSQHCQPYQDTGSSEVFDVIPGALIETGAAGTFAVNRIDNTKFWVHQDERGARQVWRASGYTPQRVSTFAVENDLASYSVDQISGASSYAYQDAGHLFWVLYVPGSSWSWAYDVAEQAWHKRAMWNPNTAQWGAHWSWNHAYCGGKHIVGVWNRPYLYEMSRSILTDETTGDDQVQNIRRYRRSPTLVDEMQWIYFSNLTLDFATGVGPQPPLTDGDGNPREPQVMVRWSDDRGQNWSNEHILGLGFAGQYKTRVIIWRLGRSRYRVWEVSVTDPVDITLIEGYLNTQ